jgi:site-specific DNA-methyltransferase (adenine-specific)
MRNKLNKITEQEEEELSEIPLHINGENIPLDALVSLPLVQVNEINFGDSLMLAGCVPAKADLILEDMPYNSTNCEFDKEPIDLEKYWESRIELIKPTGVICLTASQPFTSKLIMSNEKMFKYEIIWDKVHPSNPYLAKYMPLKVHENILVFYQTAGGVFNQIRTKNTRSQRAQRIKNGKHIKELYGESNKEYIYKNDGTSSPVSILAFMKDTTNCSNKERTLGALHPTQKPVGLFEYLVRTYTNEGDLVFDGFGGSGTTAIAAYRSNRNFIVIEKDKKYFDLAVRRLAQERNQLRMFK